MNQGPIQTDGTAKIEWFREKLLFSRCVGRRNTDKSPDPGCGILRTVTLQFSKGKERSQGRGKNLHIFIQDTQLGKRSKERWRAMSVCVMHHPTLQSIPRSSHRLSLT